MAVLKFVPEIAVDGPTQRLIRSTRNFEKELLGTLDEYMNSESNRRFPNPTMLGLCVRRLSLYYRRELFYLNYFKNGVTNGKWPPKWPTYYWRWIRECQEFVTTMYDGCISAYSKVYHKSKSPYSLSWRLQDRIEEFGNDDALIKKFEQIRTQERKFYGSKTPLELTFLVANCNRRGF